MKINYNLIWLWLLSMRVVAGIQIHSIKPDVADPRIRTFIADSHYVVSADPAKQKNSLLVHLGASYQKPGDASYYLQLAANAGYHVISLAYPGINNMYATCEHSTDPLCYENFHREVAEGRNYSPWIEIDTFESIFFRLQSVLKFLQMNYPQENWSSYLDGQGRLLQSKITWSGHSDGAGHAAVIAKYYAVHRVVCFSGPKDFSLHYYLPPVWTHTGEWKTDKSALYVFAHTSDEYAFQKEIWDSLGLNKFGPPVNVASSNSPYKSSHQLITSAAVSIADIHGSTILDTRSPKESGKYVFEPVWKYLLGIESGTSILVNEFTAIRLFPNPIQRGRPLSIRSPVPIQDLELIDVNGKIYKINNQNFQLDPQRAAGLYFVRVKMKQQVYTCPLLVY